MKKKSKLTILSIITSAVIITSSIPVNRNSNRFVSGYYDVLMDDIIEEYMLLDEEYNFIPKNNFVPQGIEVVDQYVIISNFDYYKDNNSILCVYDSEGKLVNECMLEHDAHVGGIAYDKSNNLLWVTGYAGNIHAYDIDEVLSKNKIKSKYNQFYVGEGLNNYVYPWLSSASFVTMYNDELLVGNFSLSNDGKIKRYTIDVTDKDIKLKYKGYFRIPDMVQGVTFHAVNNQEYILFSRSYGRDTPSILQVFRYDKDIKDYRSKKLISVSFKLDPMLEQIVSYDNKLYAVYECNAIPYVSKQNLDFDSIPVYDANDVVKKLELKIDTN